MISVFPENSFFIHCLGFSCMIFLGISLGFFIKFIIPTKNARPCRFVGFCIFLSLTAISYTFLIFLTKTLFPLSIFTHSFILAPFLWGILLALFWKILFPFSFVVYISLTVATNYILNSLFESVSETIPITISENSVKIENRDFPKKPEFYYALKISSYHIPDELVFPVRRNWFLLGEFAESNMPFEKVLDTSDSEGGNSVLIAEFKNPKILENRLASFYLNHFIFSGKPCVLTVPIPDEKICPSLYSAHISFKDNEISCEIVRDL